MPSLGNRLRELRRTAGLTQRELAAAAHVDPTYLSKIENDRLEHTPSVRTIQSIAAAIRADEIELMELANKLPPVLEVFAREPEARRFLAASRSLRTAEDWRAATKFVEQRVAARSGRAASRRADEAG